jgi:hypothetical protein
LPRCAMTGTFWAPASASVSGPLWNASAAALAVVSVVLIRAARSAASASRGVGWPHGIVRALGFRSGGLTLHGCARAMRDAYPRRNDRHANATHALMTDQPEHVSTVLVT